MLGGFAMYLIGSGSEESRAYLATGLVLGAVEIASAVYGFSRGSCP